MAKLVQRVRCFVAKVKQSKQTHRVQALVHQNAKVRTTKRRAEDERTAVQKEQTKHVALWRAISSVFQKRGDVKACLAGCNLTTLNLHTGPMID